MSTERKVEYVTPYQLIRLLNSRYEGSNRPTQMGYNYVKNGYIPSVIVNNQRVIEVSVAELWLEEFASRNNLKKVTPKK